MPFSLETMRPYLEHPYTHAVFALALTLLSARLLGRLVSTIVSKMAEKAERDLDDHVLEMLHGPSVNTIILFGFIVAIQLLNLPVGFEAGLVRTLLTVILIFWMGFLFKVSTRALQQASESKERFKHVVESTFPIFNNAMRLLILAIGVYLFNKVWDIDTTGWLASAGVLGIAVGFAAKDSLSNLFAGVFIIADAPYRVGDVINIDSGERGAVTHIGIRSTRILTRDNIEITIPNAILGNSKVTNESQPTKLRRLKVSVGVAYGSDIKKVKEVLLEVAAEEKRVLKRPAPEALFRAFGDSSLDFELRYHLSKPGDIAVIEDVMNSAVYEAFREASIEIPFPQRDLHVISMPDKN